MKKILSIHILLILIPIAGFVYLASSREDQATPLQNEKPASTTLTSVPSYGYLFESQSDPKEGNIVGHFGYGAFAWYVPDWLEENWKMETYKGEGMKFIPDLRADPEDFSDILFDVSTSTEMNNAENLSLARLESIPRDKIKINEVLLNRHSGGRTTIQMETDTRIYHTVSFTSDFSRIIDYYAMDGKNKTLEIYFESKAELYPQFSDKIRDLVEGIGELQAPQG